MNTYAIVESGGEQLQVKPGRVYDIRHIASRVVTQAQRGQDCKLLLCRVLVVASRSSTLVGTPWVQGAVVKGRLLHVIRNKKVLIYKMHPKKKTRRKTGYRQQLARFVVDAIYVKSQGLVSLIK